MNNFDITIKSTQLENDTTLENNPENNLPKKRGRKKKIVEPIIIIKDTENDVEQTTEMIET